MKKGLIIFSLATLCVTSQAQEGWTLRQCIDYAIEHNIEIQQTANEAEQNAIEVNTAKGNEKEVFDSCRQWSL